MEEIKNFKNRNIAITDLETTGLDPDKHEIIEIGMVLVNQPAFEIIDTYEVKVRPQHIETADPNSLQLNGYKPKNWENAVTLKDAVSKYIEKTKESLFCAHNINMDKTFLVEACKKTGLTLQMDYHCIDVPSIIWFKYRKSTLERINLSLFAKFLGLEPEPDIHSAMNGAMLEYKVLKKMLAE